MAHLANSRYEPSPLNRPPRVLDRQQGHVQWDTRHKVCLYGAGWGHRCAPLEDPSWVVWALNVIPPVDSQGRLRADAWFELHERKAQSADDLRWIAACPVPIFVPDDLMDASPQAVRFPVERLEARYHAYWACTFAYQLAMALDAGFKEVGLYGVELALGTPRERTVEWACVSWWIGYLQGRGVRIRVPAGGRLGAHRCRYGFDYDAEIEDVQGYVDRMAAMDREERRLSLRRASVGG